MQEFEKICDLICSPSEKTYRLGLQLATNFNYTVKDFKEILEEIVRRFKTGYFCVKTYDNNDILFTNNLPFGIVYQEIYKPDYDIITLKYNFKLKNGIFFSYPYSSEKFFNHSEFEMNYMIKKLRYKLHDELFPIKKWR